MMDLLGNGRALSLWEPYRRGFDTHHIFSVDEDYCEDRPGYYAALDQVRRDGEDLSRWLEYCTRSKEGGKITLTPKQEKLLQLLRDHGSLAPSEIWNLLSLSKQGAMNVIKPLLAAGLIIKKGSKKTGKYYLQEG